MYLIKNANKIASGPSVSRPISWHGLIQSVAILLCVFHISVGRAELPPIAVFALEAVDCRGENPAQVRYGSGFIIKNFINDSNSSSKYLLLTALHVVANCRELRLKKVNCESGDVLEEKAFAMDSAGDLTIYAFPSLDLAAIPVFVPDSQPDRAFGLPVAKLDLSSKMIPSMGTPLFIFGREETRGAAVCVFHAGVSQGVTRVDYLARHLASRSGGKWTEGNVRGDLDPQIRVLTYDSSAGPGVSGGAIYLPNEKVVIGIHDAGVPGRRTTWGILLSGSMLEKNNRQGMSVQKMASVRWNAPQLAQARQLESEFEGKVMTRRREFVLRADAETRLTTVNQPTWTALGPRVGITGEIHLFGRPPIPPGAMSSLEQAPTHSLGIEATITPVFMSHRFSYRAPEGSELEFKNAFGGGVVLETDLWLRLFRLRAVGVSFGVGVRFGFSLLPNASDELETFGLFGVPAHLQLSIALSGYRAFLVRAYVAAEYQIPNGLTYTISGTVNPDDRTWFPTGGLGVGLAI